MPLLAHVYGVSPSEVSSWTLFQYRMMVKGVSKILGGKEGSSGGSVSAARSVGIRTPLG